MGDYIKLILPTQAGRSVLESDRRLRQLERICRFEYFFDSPSSDDSDSNDEVDPAEESESGCSRHTLPEPEPHDGLATPVCLVEGLSDSYCYQPFRAHPRKSEAHGQISFAEVWDLLFWLDSATTLPGWLLHGDHEWHDSTLSWLDGDWWSFQKRWNFGFTQTAHAHHKEQVLVLSSLSEVKKVGTMVAILHNLVYADVPITLNCKRW